MSEIFIGDDGLARARVTNVDSSGNGPAYNADGSAKVQLLGSIAQWAVTGDSSANTALTITKAAVTG